jgi:PAS domain S-box-containing protein
MRIALFPRSLVARVYALYALTLLVFVGAGLGIFYKFQFSQHIGEAQDSAMTVVDITAQTISDSAVIGDFDSIQHMLKKTVTHTQFDSASFIDASGSRLRESSINVPRITSPEWLRNLIVDDLKDINRVIAVGGRDYGVLRLAYDVNAISGSLWELVIDSLALALAGLVFGLLLIRFALARWLGSLARVQTFERDLQAGVIDPSKALAGDVPLEFRDTFAVLARTAESLRQQLDARDNAIRSLRSVVRGLMPEADAGSSTRGTDDIEALSTLIERLVNEREIGRRALINQKFALDQHAIVSVADRHDRITYVNDKFCEVSGYSREELIGKTYEVVRSNEHPQALYDDLWNTINSGRVWRGELCNRSKDGKLHWLYGTVVPLLGPDGKPEEFIAIRTDITERKRIEAELRRTTEIAESANRAKSEFLANMSHEIRTPMNAVIGMTRLALDSSDAEEQREFMRTVQISADALLSIINDILDFSKIEAGKLSMEVISFSMRSMLSETLKGLSPRAHDKNLELILDIAPELPEALLGDPGRLRQIALNLAGNAIKFTDSGEVRVHVRCKDREDGAVDVTVTITDTGIGIPEEKRAAIFESFTQEDTSTTRRYGGTGLGLAISSSLVSLMGGHIELESEVGRGSTFSFTVRLGVDATRTGHPVPPATLAGMHALIVDDNKANRDVLAAMLAQWNVETRQADSGEMALKALQAAPADIVLLDGRMPGMDGFTTAEAILGRPDAPRVALLSSMGARGDAARCRELGITGYLPKPVGRDDLLGVLQRMLGAPPEDRKTLVTRHVLREKPQQAPLDVLVAEDHPINRLLVLKLLERWGHHATIAEDGQQALEQLRKRRDDNKRFDVVFMDLQMPVMGGLKATQLWRAEEKAPRTPIIAMTASAMVSDRDASLAAGMDDYIAKPIDQNALRALLDRLSAKPRAVS